MNRARLLSLACMGALVAFPVRGLAAQTASAATPLRSSIFLADSGAVRTTSGGGTTRAIVDSPTLTLAKLEMHETTLPPGKAPHPGHRHLHEEMMIVRTGTMEVQLGETIRRVGPGDIVFAASNEFHGWKNAGTTTATYLVIRLDTPEIAAAAKAAAAKSAAKP